VKLRNDKIGGRKTLFVQFTKKQDGKTDKETHEGMGEVHIDLIDEFERLDFHVTLICEQVNLEEAEEVEEIVDNLMVRNHWKLNDHDTIIASKITCTGLSMGGSGDYLGVTLIGRRELEEGKILNLITPFTTLKHENSSYMYRHELYSILMRIETEVLLYLEGKRAPEAQLELGF